MDKSLTTQLKGIAITLITIGHCFGDFTRAITPFGGIGVALFLILSGYGLNESRMRQVSGNQSGLSGGGVRYWQKRIAKVWVPWFILISIVSLLSNKGLIDYIREISWFGASLWYVRYILYCYVVFYVTSFIPKSSYRVCAIAAIAIVSILVLDGVEGEQWASFLLGVILSEYKSMFVKHKPEIKKSSWTLLLFGVAFLAIKQTGWYRGFEADDALISTTVVNIIQSVIKVSFAAYILYWMYMNKTWRSQLIGFIGGISYELFLVQMFFYGKIHHSVTLAFSVICGTVFIAWLLNVLCDLISSKMLSKEYK